VVFKELPDMSVDLFHNLMIRPESQERLKEMMIKKFMKRLKTLLWGIRMKIIFEADVDCN
jgi:hypothetical protein